MPVFDGKLPYFEIKSGRILNPKQQNLPINPIVRFFEKK